MIGLCALVWASVCIPEEQFFITRHVAMFSNAEMNTHNREAEAAQFRTGMGVIIDYSDSMSTIPADKLDKACDSSLCIYYRRHCESPLRCKIVLGRLPARSNDPSVVMGDTLEIFARTPQEMRILMESFTFVKAATWTRNVQAGTITVAMLDKESPDMDIQQFEPRRTIRP